MAKLKTMSQVVEGKTLLAHLIMEQIHKTDWFKKMPKRRENMTHEEIDNETLEIKLTVEGEELDVVSFFEEVENQLERMIKEQATAIVKEQTSGKLEELANKMLEMNEVANAIAEDINWDYSYDKNIFKKSLED